MLNFTEHGQRLTSHTLHSMWWLNVQQSLSVSRAIRRSSCIRKVRYRVPNSSLTWIVLVLIRAELIWLHVLGVVSSSIWSGVPQYLETACSILELQALHLPVSLPTRHDRPLAPLSQLFRILYLQFHQLSSHPVAHQLFDPVAHQHLYPAVHQVFYLAAHQLPYLAARARKPALELEILLRME